MLGEPICVYGLWHLGSVTAACLAASGRKVIGLDLDAARIAALQQARPPVAEPGLAELLESGMRDGLLEFTTQPAIALKEAGLVWVTFDTPVDEDDRADPGFVRAQLDLIRPYVRPDAIVMVSSQVPVGFTGDLERAWRLGPRAKTDLANAGPRQRLSQKFDRPRLGQKTGLSAELPDQPRQRFACSPENLRLGRAIEAFRKPNRVVVGLGEGLDREPLAELFRPFCERIEWMSLASAEMSKHALNGYLALSVAYANELARICERVGADSGEVERALRSDPRVGPNAYVSAGPPFAGGTLARDVEFLRLLASAHGIASPLADGIAESNRLHGEWTRNRLSELLAGISAPRVTLLGLTYKPGTDTLRRSASVELGRWLLGRGVEVRAFDPAIHAITPELANFQLVDDIDGALIGSDVAVLATAWPEFTALNGEAFATRMRHARVVDQAGVLDHLRNDTRVTYVRVGRPVS